MNFRLLLVVLVGMVWLIAGGWLIGQANATLGLVPVIVLALFVLAPRPSV